MKTNYLTSTDSLHQAYLLKHKLEHEGIHVILKNQIASNLVVFGPGLKAEGIHIFVLEKDFE